jgi:TolB-like protein/class 3 adenylate cyclase/Tfp pilus assembly protein PilF
MKVERRLAAILHADVKGYSRLIGEDEVATLPVLAAYLDRMKTLVQQHGGHAVGSRGDSLLAEFPSVVEAVQCAVEIQQHLKIANAEFPVARRIEFRIGINLGEIVVDGEQIHGDGINIAVRLEGLAEAGGIFISDVVREQVKNRLPLQYKYIGERALKNIATPVRVWQVVAEPRPSGSKAESQKLSGVTPRSWSRIVLVGLLVAGGISSLLYFLLPSPTPPSASRIQEESPSLPPPDKTSIVVLPFVNLSKDPDQEYFSDGLTETLTGDLSQISSLFVIARDSAFTYKGKAVKVQDVAREMGVRYVLEGSVLKADNQVRIAAQLIDATTGYHLWSERYDRPWLKILTLQDEIVRKIVTTLKLQLAVQEIGDVVGKHTENVEAYDAFLRGQTYFLRFTKETNAQARQMFEKALALDPQYAEACAFLSWSYWIDWTFRWNADPQTLERASALAQQAVSLDDSLPQAHSSLSWVLAQQHQYQQAIAEGERGIALDPNNADSYAHHAETLLLAGRPEDALRAVEQAVRLNPRYPFWYSFFLGYAYTFTGRYAEAIAIHKEALSRNPDFLPTLNALTVSYCLQWLAQQSPATQTLEPAEAVIQRALALNDSYHWSHVNLGSIYLYQRQYEKALAETVRGAALAPTEAGTHAALANVLSHIGRAKEALEASAQALRLQSEFTDSHLLGVGTAYAVAGHDEQAKAPLQRYLSRYPNILSAHLTLAAVYSELGQEAEAQAEAAEVRRLNPHFSLAVHRQRMPIKDPAVLERHIAALRKAGLN